MNQSTNPYWQLIMKLIFESLGNPFAAAVALAILGVVLFAHAGLIPLLTELIAAGIVICLYLAIKKEKANVSESNNDSEKQKP